MVFRRAPPLDSSTIFRGKTLKGAAVATITLGGIEYELPDFNRTDRASLARVRSAVPKLDELSEIDTTSMLGSLDAADLLYEIVGILLPDIPQERIDELPVPELKDLFTELGVVAAGSISLGESSASTTS